MPAEVPPPPPRPKISKSTFAVVLAAVIMVLFIYTSTRTGGSGEPSGAGMPPAPTGPTIMVGTPAATATATLKPVPQGTLGVDVAFTSLQGYGLTIPKGWRILPYIGPLGTDLIVQAPESKTEASVFTVTVTDASKSPVKDPVTELPSAGAFEAFAPTPAKRIMLDGAPAATQQASIRLKKGSARIMQFFVGHHKRAYNLVGICPSANFDKRRAQIQSMVDSLRWIAPKMAAPTQPPPSQPKA